MAQDLYAQLDRYKQRGQELQQAVKQVKAQQQTKQKTSSLFREGAAEIIKDQFGVNKRHSRPILDILEQGGGQQDPMQALKNEFDQWFTNLKEFVGTISEETKTNRQNSQKLLRKFNRVERKVKLETKLKHALRAIRELKNLDLVYNDKLKRRKQETATKTKTGGGRSTPKHPVENLSLTEMVERGETEAIEFKQAMPNSVRKITEELVALATHKGGVLILGVTDDGSVVGVDEINEVEETVVNVVRNNVDPPMDPTLTKKSIDGKDVLVVEVGQFSDTPHSVNGTFYKRVGTSKRKLTGSDLRNLFS